VFGGKEFEAVLVEMMGGSKGAYLLSIAYMGTCKVFLTNPLVQHAGLLALRLLHSPLQFVPKRRGCAARARH
jgi:hypothetical protein